MIAIVWTVTPIYWTVAMSVQFESDVYVRNPSLFPLHPTDYFYLLALGLPVPKGLVRTGISASEGIPKILSQGLRNSIIVAVVTSTITVGVASVAAYVFARLRFRFKNGLLVTLLASQSLPPIAVIVPYFILLGSLRLVGSITGLIIVYLSLLIPLVTWVLMSFFATLPWDVEKAARMDGCGRLMVLRKIVMPLAAPGIFVGWVLAFLYSYNEFVYALILTSGTPAQTMPLAVTVLFMQETTYPTLAAVVTLSLIPVFIVALFFQKYMTQLRMVDPAAVIIR
jgi:multiple sugar transport system permease protein